MLNTFFDGFGPWIQFTADKSSLFHNAEQGSTSDVAHLESIQYDVLYCQCSMFAITNLPEIQRILSHRKWARATTSITKKARKI